MVVVYGNCMSLVKLYFAETDVGNAAFIVGQKAVRADSKGRHMVLSVESVV